MQFSRGKIDGQILWGKYIDQSTFLQKLRGKLYLLIRSDEQKLLLEFILPNQDGKISSKEQVQNYAEYYNIEFANFQEEYLDVLNQIYDQIDLYRVLITNISNVPFNKIKPIEICQIIQHVAHKAKHCIYRCNTDLIYNLAPQKIYICIMPHISSEFASCHSGEARTWAQLDEFADSAILAIYLLKYYQNKKIFLNTRLWPESLFKDYVEFMNNYLLEEYSLVIDNLEGMYIMKNE